MMQKKMRNRIRVPKRNSPMLWLLAGFLVAFSCIHASGAQASETFSLHPENPRYFLFRGKPTVLVTSAEHYGLLCNRVFDVNVYLDELASHGLNHTRVFAGAYRETPGAFGITNNSLAPTDENFLAPWKRTEKTHRDGSPIFDLTKWDEAYFTRLDHILTEATARDIVVEVCLFSPMYTPGLWDVNPMNIRNNVNKVGDVGSQEVFTTQHQDLLDIQIQLAEKLTEFLQPYDNVYIEICNEPYWAGVQLDWQRKIVDVVDAKQKEIGSANLISINVANKTAVVENPQPAVSIYNFHYCHPPVAVAENADLNLPIGENETGFRGSEDFLYRTEAWDFLVAGGAIYNNLDYSFSVMHPAGTQDDYQSPGGGSEELREQLGLLKRTFDRLPIVHLKPLPDDFVTATDALVASAIGNGTDQFLVYVHVSLPEKMGDQPPEPFTRAVEGASLVIALPSGNYVLTMINPQTGEETLVTKKVEEGVPASVRLESFETDIAVLCQRKPD